MPTRFWVQFLHLRRTVASPLEEQTAASPDSNRGPNPGPSCTMASVHLENHIVCLFFVGEVPVPKIV